MERIRQIIDQIGCHSVVYFDTRLFTNSICRIVESKIQWRNNGKWKS